MPHTSATIKNIKEMPHKRNAPPYGKARRYEYQAGSGHFGEVARGLAGNCQVPCTHINNDGQLWPASVLGIQVGFLGPTGIARDV
jgi:hypothetical protein